MTSLLSRLLVAGVLAIGVTGCGPSLHYSSHHGYHHHHHGGAEAVGLAAGFIVGAAVAASAAEREPPPEPDGRISKVVVDEPAGMEAAAAKCIGDRIGTATVAPFKGSLVTMGTTYHVS